MQAIRSLILMLCYISLVFADLSPVFLWGAHSETRPSLTPISGDEFVKLVTPLLDSKAMVVFLENDLRNKDFMCSSNIDDGKSCYARLQGVKQKTYYAAVENPIDVLGTLASEYKYKLVDSSGNISTPLETEPGKINFLKFGDENPSSLRESSLHLHDSIMASISSQFGDNVFFMYTSASSGSSLKRQRRQTTSSTPGYVFRNKANLLLYYKSLSIVHDDSVTNLEIKSMDVKSDNDTEMSITLTPVTGSPLFFDVTLAGGYFFMKNVMHDQIKYLSSEVYAPTSFSYFCGNLTLNNIPNENVTLHTLKWDHLQFQAPFDHTKNESFAFGDAWHCVGFFTGGILSGLLIVVLLLAITFIGVCWMMDINTMDRFDDPKGKTITISASD